MDQVNVRLPERINETLNEFILKSKRERDGKKIKKESVIALALDHFFSFNLSVPETERLAERLGIDLNVKK